MSEQKYRSLYKQYKRRYLQMAFENKRMEAVLQGNLLNGSFDLGIQRQRVMVSTPKSSESLPRKLCFSSVDETSSDSDSAILESGANKWECLSDKDKDRLNYSRSKNTPPAELDETYYEPAEKNKCDNTNERSVRKEGATTNTPKRSNTPNKKYETRSNTAKTPQKLVKKKPKKKTPEHVCKWPRCEEHHKFRVSSKRELEKLSPKSRKMATRDRVPSPKNYWDLNMPSTQEIRSRNQELD
ncbi:hypothetical protein FOCC_FOCC006578 [Frankliniella occidentalis]|nr:hypothetical protein FOCC_FOCC006578 [Frankliniella occidentalis]